MNLLCCLKRAQAAVVQELLTSQHLTMEYYWNLCYLLFLTDNMSVFECLSWYSKHGQWATVEFVHFSKWIPKFYFVVFYSVALPYWKHTKPWPQIQKTYRTLNFVNVTPLLSSVASLWLMIYFVYTFKSVFFPRSKNLLWTLPSFLHSRTAQWHIFIMNDMYYWMALRQQ